MTAYIKVGISADVVEDLKAEADREHRSVANLTGAILLKHFESRRAPLTGRKDSQGDS